MNYLSFVYAIVTVFYAEADGYDEVAVVTSGITIY